MSKIPTRKPQIFIGGMCSLPLGVMERQFGNMAIVNPMIDNFKNLGKHIDIVTSLQLSREYSEKKEIISLDIPALYETKIFFGLVSVFDLLRSAIWKILNKSLKQDLQFLISGKKLQILYHTDIYIDFSGDTYGDVAYWGHFLKHSLDLLTIRNLNTPIFMFAQSSGPFSKKWKKILAKFVLNKTTIITTREPIAYENLSKLNLNTPLFSLACPSWLFDIQKTGEIIEFIHKYEHVKIKKGLLVGFNITGFNFAKNLFTANKTLYSKDRYSEKRSQDEIQPVIELLHGIVVERDLNLLLVSHVFRLNDDRNLIPGPDSKITEQIYERFIETYPNKKYKINIIRNPYTPEIMKEIIGLTDIFISGRLHAGVAAMSQLIPTILLAYGPKHFGFSRLLGIENLVVDNLGAKFNQYEILHNLDYAIKNKENIKKQMEQSFTLTRNKSLLNFKFVAEILSLKTEDRILLNEDLLDKFHKIIQVLENKAT